MAYKKPTCDCGFELVSVAEKSVAFIRRVNKNGRLSKKESKNFRPSVNNTEWLECPKCHKEYEADLDELDRIIRGDKRD